ncbi:MAG: hypothetical protein ACRDIX_05725 [Actinomycetota bacterium]
MILRVHEEPRVYAVHYFSVTVEFEADVSAAALTGDSEAEDYDALAGAITEADRLAVETAARLRRWIFVRQPDLGPSGELPPRLWSDQIREKETGRDIPVAPTITLYGSRPTEETALSSQDFENLAPSLAGLIEPPEPETLLSQARGLLIHQRGKVVQPELAVLLAAVAAEVKAKRTWEAVVSPETQPLLDVLFKNPRAFPQSAIDLFDKVARAVAGRSLREERRNAYKQLERLFELRNAVAHTAARIDEREARIAVQSVPMAFEWLDSLGA